MPTNSRRSNEIYRRRSAIAYWLSFFAPNQIFIKKNRFSCCCCFCLFAALLAGTLRTYQKAGCDAEYISLSCPRGTSISIEVAQYGNTLKGKMSNENDELTTVHIAYGCGKEYILSHFFFFIYFTLFYSMYRIFSVRTRSYIPRVTSSNKCSVILCFPFFVYNLLPSVHLLTMYPHSGEARRSTAAFIIDGKKHAVLVNLHTDTYWFRLWVFFFGSSILWAEFVFRQTTHFYGRQKRGRHERRAKENCRDFVFFFLKYRTTSLSIEKFYGAHDGGQVAK